MPALKNSPVTFILIAVNVAAYVLMASHGSNFMQPGGRTLVNWGANFAPLTVGHGELWRLFTSMFLHGGFAHIIGNMWFLYLFGFAVEGRMRSLKFAALYFISGLAGDVLHLGLFGPAHPEIPTIGASGAGSGS